MRGSSYIGQHGAAKPRHLGVFVLLLFACMGLAGCGDSCFVFVSNPGGGTIRVSNPSCSFSTGTGNVRLRLGASVPPALAYQHPSSIQHIFLTLRGVEALTIPLDAATQPEWQELAPSLATQPAQVDLTEQGAGLCASSPFGDAAIRAGVYSQVRFRLVPDQVAAEIAPGENVCGAKVINCVITADGAVHPLVWSPGPPSKQAGEQVEELLLPVVSPKVGGGIFRVLPDANLDLAVLLDSDSSFLFPAGNTMRFVPVFGIRQNARDTCASDLAL